ncbi:mechanosensitive ion channel [Alcaligenaceae bacterium CGII-47]|nr:mechanosensitive ion channel [Alcaligenaceae bacterium CGII-47]
MSLFVVFALALGGFASVSAAESDPTDKAATTPADTIDTAAIRARIEALKARPEASASDRNLVLDQLGAALARAESAASARKMANDYATILKNAPEVIADLSADAADLSETSAALQESDGDPVRTQLQLASLQAEAVSLRSRQREIEDAVAALSMRPLQARAELEALRQELGKVAATVPGNASTSLAEASRLRAEAERQDLSAQIEKTEQDLLSLPTRQAIAVAQRDLVARRLQRTNTGIAALETRIDAQRAAVAQRKEAQAQEAAQRLAGQPAALRRYATDTIELRAQLSKLADELDQTRRPQADIRARLDRVSASRESINRLLTIGRIDDEQGRLLRGLESQLPATAALERSLAARNDALVDAHIDLFRVEQQLGALQDVSTAAARELADAGLPDSAATVATMQQLVAERRAALADRSGVLGQWIETLAELNAQESQLMQGTKQLRSMLDKRLLWLPSATPLDSTWLTDLGRGFRWLFARENWTFVSRDVLATWQARPLLPLLLLGTVVGLFATRARLLRLMKLFAYRVDGRHDSFGATLSALMISVLLALPAPLMIGVLGYLMRSRETANVFTIALGNGMIAAAAALFMIGLYRVMCRPFGLFISHFRWGARATQRLGRALALLALAIGPAAFLTGMTNVADDPELPDGLGRFGFLIGSLALTLFLYRVFKPQGGALTGNIERSGLVWRTRWLWFWGLVATPILLAALALAGYYVTASELQGRLFTSGWILLAVVIAFDVVMRGVLVTSRHAARLQAQARRAKALVEAQSNAAADASGDAMPGIPDAPDIDIVTVGQQTKALLRAAAGILLALLLWGIWNDIVPALDVFNDVVLWSQVQTTVTGDAMVAVTLGHLMLSVAILVLTVIGARNLPGFMEIAFLQRFLLDAGTRYAIVTISRYVIVAVGLLWAFNYIGVDWSKLQWIIAALGVGLGFGLQEIVANFVSGIIILFERPVRVGDLVTIGNTSGTVTRIKIRAITITDFENFEVLVPNKAFITESVQNWSLTSPVTRLLLKVGIAYGSNVVEAQRLMLDAVKANEQVLDSPAPSVWFLGFGDSALEFEVRAFVGRIEQRMQTQHELYVALNATLKQAGIEIPFPQRDVHLRTSDDVARRATGNPEREGDEKPA